MENWNPAFPGERVSWYREYIQRCGPTAVSWFQEPRPRHGNLDAGTDVMGVALYAPSRTDLLAVSPCLLQISAKSTSNASSKSAPSPSRPSSPPCRPPTPACPSPSAPLAACTCTTSAHEVGH